MPFSSLMRLICLSLLAISLYQPLMAQTRQSDRLPVFLPVKKQGQWGAIDEKGQWLIEPRYDYLSDRHQEHDAALFRKGQHLGLVNTSGREIIPAKYPKLFMLTDQLMAAGYDSIFAVYDWAGTQLVPLVVDSLAELTGDLVAIRVAQPTQSASGDLMADTWVIANQAASQVALTELDSLTAHNDLGYWLHNGHKIGLLNAMGEIAFPPTFDRMTPASETFVTTGPGWRSGRRDSTFYYLEVVSDGLRGLADYQADWLVPPRFDSLVSAIRLDYFEVSQNDKWGIYRRDLDSLIVPVRYDEVARSSFSLSRWRSVTLWVGKIQTDSGLVQHSYTNEGKRFRIPDFKTPTVTLNHGFALYQRNNANWELYGSDMQRRLERLSSASGYDTLPKDVLLIGTPGSRMCLYAIASDSLIMTCKSLVQFPEDSLVKIQYQSGAYALLNTAYERISPLGKAINPWSAGLFKITSRNGKQALLNRQGQLISKSYHQIGSVESDDPELPPLAEVRNGNSKGLITRWGEEVIPAKYEKLTFIGNRIHARNGDRLSVFEVAGNGQTRLIETHDQVLALKVNNNPDGASGESAFSGRRPSGSSRRSGGGRFGSSPNGDQRFSSSGAVMPLASAYGNWKRHPQTGLWGLAHPSRGVLVPHIFRTLDVQYFDELGFVIPLEPSMTHFQLKLAKDTSFFGQVPNRITDHLFVWDTLRMYNQPIEHRDTLWYAALASGDTLWEKDWIESVARDTSQAEEPSDSVSKSSNLVYVDDYSPKIMIMDSDTAKRIELSRGEPYNYKIKKSDIPGLFEIGNARFFRFKDFKYVVSSPDPSIRKLNDHLYFIMPKHVGDKKFATLNPSGGFDRNTKVSSSRNAKYYIYDTRLESIVSYKNCLKFFPEINNPYQIHRAAFGISYQDIYVGLGFSFVKGMKSKSTLRVKRNLETVFGKKEKISVEKLTYIGPWVDGYARFNVDGKISYYKKTSRLEPFLSQERDDEDFIIYKNQYFFIINDDVFKIEGGTWGYIDEQVRIKMHPNFGYASTFNNESAIVKEDGKYGLIDTDMKWQLKPEYSKITFGNEEGSILLAAKKQESEVILDVRTGLASQGAYEALSEWEEDGIRAYRQGKYWGLALVAEGKRITPPIYDEIEPMREGLAAFRTQGQWGYLNQRGEEQIPARFRKCRPFSSKLAAVLTQRGWTFVTPQGQPIVDSIYTKLGDFDGETSWAYRSGQYFLIDAMGTDAPINKRNIQFKTSFSAGLAVSQGGNGYGLINKEMDWVILPRYSRIREWQNGIYLLHTSGKPYKSIYFAKQDSTPDLEIRRYQSIDLGQGYLRLMLDTSWIVLDHQGEVVADQQNQPDWSPDQRYFQGQTPRELIAQNFPIIGLTVEDPASNKSSSLGTSHHKGRRANWQDYNQDFQSGWQLLDQYGLPQTLPIFANSEEISNDQYVLTGNHQYYILNPDGQRQHEGWMDWAEWALDKRIIRVGKGDKIGYFSLSDGWIWPLQR